MAWSLIEQIEQHQGLITVAEAAKMLGISRKGVYARIERGEIPTVNFGGESRQVSIDPDAWKFVLLRLNPVLREARRHSSRAA